MLPIMVDLKERSCLVVGGGGVALRKVQALLEAGAAVTVVSPEAVEPLRTMAEEGALSLAPRAYEPGEASTYALVFAATDSGEVNRQVAEDAAAAGVWANVADNPSLCSFHLPARVRRGPLQLSIASSGWAPFVVRRLRQVFERRLGQEWGEWLEAAARFRRAVRRQPLNRAQREVCYDSFFSSTVNPERLSARVPTAREEREWLSAPVEDHRQPSAPPSASCRRGVEEGTVSLVGAGPGCAGLLTVRGRQRLLAADAVVYDRLAAAALPPDLPARVELHCVGKTAGSHPIPQEEINALLVRLAREGRRVVRLKGGDPFVFGRGGEEGEALEEAGIVFEVIPGVTSGIAAAAWIGVPVTHRREAVRLTLLTAHEAVKSGGHQVRWDLLARDRHATIVGYMGVTALPRVVEELLGHGMDPETPAAMVEQGTTAAQRHVVSTVAGLPHAVRRAGITPPALFIIGPTVEHAGRLDWFGRLPLAHHRLLVPASNRELIPLLETSGAEVVATPLPLTPAARIAMAALPLTGCVVRSPAEVDWLNDELGGPSWHAQARSWCLGEDTVERAASRGWRRVQLLDREMSCADLVSQIASLGPVCDAGADNR
jgi:uroporphyrin-III C-methyltransferase/precorrin-2 dehydrogenase/sirohydrochlorin ferrochelatase